MVVIARFPRLDSNAVAESPAAPVVVRGAQSSTTIDPAVVTAPSSPKGDAGAAKGGRPRAPRNRFPAVSTLVLAMIAGMFWVAVWREEQRRAAEDADRDREALAMEADREAGLNR